MSRKFRFERTLTVCIAASALLLAGCSSGDTSENRSGESESGSVVSSKVTVWHYYTLDNQIGMIDQYKETFLATHPDTEVEYVYVPMDQMNSKLIAAAGAGTGPDIIVADGFNVGTLAAAEALAPIDDYWSSYPDANQFSEGALKKVDDKLFGVQGHVNSLGLWCNMDILKKIGTEPPTTIAELEEAMKAAKDAGYQGITLSGDPTIQGAFQGYSWWTSEGFNFANPQQADLAAAFSRVKDWVDKGYLSPQVATWDQNVPFSEFLAGNVAFAQNGNWQISAARDEADFDFLVVPLPLSSTGKVYLGGESQSIGANSSNPDLAWAFLEETYLSRDGQIQALTAVGSIPTRADAGEDPTITDDPILGAFSAAIVDQGAAYPDPEIPSQAVEKTLLAVAQGWSSALAGAQSPDDAATKALDAIDSSSK